MKSKIFRFVSGERSSDKSDDKVKSRSVIKDDDDSDDDGPNPSLDLSFNQELLKTESGDIIKDIKKKIDEKLGNYNFPDRPLKEKKLKEKLLKHEKEKRLFKDKDKKRDSDKSKFKDKKQIQRDKIKEMMRKDHQNNFYGGESEEQRSRPKKPVIVRRNQVQPPPLNFNDLLKLAEVKSKEKAPEPVFKPPKKVEERPMTQEELDRKRRAEEHRKRREEEEMGLKTKPDPSKSKNDSSILKGALTAPKVNSTGKNSPVMGSSGSKPGNKLGMAANGKTEKDRPSSSGVSGKPAVKPAAPVDNVNPWDRIYGQIKKNNPQPGKLRENFYVDTI